MRARFRRQVFPVVSIGSLSIGNKAGETLPRRFGLDYRDAAKRLPAHARVSNQTLSNLDVFAAAGWDVPADVPRHALRTEVMDREELPAAKECVVFSGQGTREASPWVGVADGVDPLGYDE